LNRIYVSVLLMLVGLVVNTILGRLGLLWAGERRWPSGCSVTSSRSTGSRSRSSRW